MDKNVQAVVSMLLQRMVIGYEKYGVTTEREDLTVEQWLQHLQEELLDAAIYIERLKNDCKTERPVEL